MSGRAGPLEPPRLGGSTFSFMWREDARRAMAAMRALGLNDFDVLVVPGHLWIDDVGFAAAPALRRGLEADATRIESLNLPALDLNLASCVPEVRRASVETYRRTLALAAELGATGVVVVPGRVSALLPPAPAASAGWLAEGVGALLREAERLDLVLHLESHPQTPLPTADALGAFVDGLGSARARIAYDVANAEFIGEDAAAAIRRLGPRIGQVHLSDATRTAWRHDALGRGTVDVPGVLEALTKIAFSGVTILEIIDPDPIAALRESLAHAAAT